MAEFLLALNTSTIRPTPLLEKIKIAGRLGFQGLEPWNDEITEHIRQGGTLAEIKTAIADAGLSVVSVIALHSWIDQDGVDHAQALDECRRRMDQAAFLESPIIVASPPHARVDLALAAARFAELMRSGREAGVRPSMEFLGFVEGVKDVASALAIAEGCGEPDATVVADVFHMVRGGGSIDDLLLLSGDRLANFHINDVPASPPPLQQTDADRVLPGDGTVDLPRVVANLRTIGYRGPVSLELFNRALWEQDPMEVCRVGLDRLRGLLDG
jgi:2-keto-myo-inositol isomerase